MKEVQGVTFSDSHGVRQKCVSLPLRALNVFFSALSPEHILFF